MRIALYARVSTKDRGQNPDTQLIPLREFASAKQWTVIQTFVDVGWSGAKEKRPALDQLMRAARARQFDGVLVWRFDRFARSTTHLLTALADFQKHKVDFISLSESIDTSSAIGKLVFTVLAAVAEMERELIRERSRAGVDRARRQGKRIGRPRTGLSFADVATLIKDGLSIRAIAKQHGCARSTVREVLKRGEN